MSTQNVKEHLDEVIDSRIDEARKLLFKTDFWSSVLLLSVFLTAVLFVAIVADQWLFTGGLSVTLRLGVSVAMLAVSVFFTYRRILPLFLYPINPVYAAQILDDNSASAKNSIINWITLKRERIERGRIATDKLGEKIFEGLTRTAAESVNAVPADRIINRNGINICLIVLGVIVSILVVYSCFSPKSPVQSFARIILPFASIEPPQATKFLDIEPRNITALQGEHLTVSAKVVGKSKSPVYVFFSTDDGRVVKQAVPMNKLTDGGSGGGFWGRSEGVRFETPFPPGKQGFVCGTDYWIQQDESKSNTYRVEVRPVATVEIESLTYRYPNYTGLAEEVVNNTGDIRAVSGTEVIVRAKSTIPLAGAEIVYDKSSSPNNTAPNLPQIKMQIDKNNPNIAFANISLKNDTPIDPNSNNTNEIINHFTINATDTDGFKSRRSGTFRQEVTRDKPPLVQWSDTAAELREVAQIDLPLNGEVELSLQAEDPDFALRYLRINYKVTSDKKINRQIKPSELLQSPSAGSTEHKGQIKKSVNFKPLKHELSVGDTVEVWGEATDTKLPIKNTAETRHITIKITEQQKNTGKNKPNEKDKQTDETKGNKNDNPDQSKNQPNEQSENQQSEEKQSGNDPNENNPKNDPQNNEMSKRQEGKQQGDNSSENKGVDNEKTSEKNGTSQDTENTASDGENSKNNNGNNNEDESKNNESKKPIDPETESADAMQKIVDQMNKDKWQQKSEPDKNNSNDPNQQDKKPKTQKQENDKVEKSDPENNQNKAEQQKSKNNEGSQDDKNGGGNNKEDGKKSEKNNDGGKGENGNETKGGKNDDKQNQPNSENSKNENTSNQQSQNGDSSAEKKSQGNKPEPTTNNSDNRQNNNSDPNSTSEPDNSTANDGNSK
ncbi:MAG: hypothetical protein LBL39_03310, partial [Planctomycetaceae bacterium]|nr:hypothetical protein [Planctomycetaceae bacterium]